MTGPDPEKGRRYAAALDNARCQGAWDELPELIRKVTKHAPQKKYYLQIANAQLRIASYIHKRPSTAQSSPSLAELIPSLLSTIESGDASPQEIFQTEVCLGWLHWTLNEPGLAAARLPKDFREAVSNLGYDILPWTEVCLVKGCYIKGAAQAIVSGPNDALETLNSLTSWLRNRSKASASTCSQFLHWSEKLLGKAALIANTEVCKNLSAPNDELVEIALELSRLWSAHPNVKQQSLSYVVHLEGPAEPASKAAIWKSYYDLLTAILQHGLVYIPPTGGADRPQLASEIQRVESIYESNLMTEVKFPTASSQNTQVEDWVEEVIRNWQILCGPNWRDEDLGEGGQNAVGRNVLDILYRAASKTYQSHLILRRLFHVHSKLADFDLALKALDSYIEVVMGAKERAEKSAQYGELESDEIFLQTLAEGVAMLCCFGSEKEAEKAKDLVVLLKKVINNQGKDGQDTSSSPSQEVSPSTIATAYRAIGIGLANWASWTPINEDRNDIRAEAIEYLESSIAIELEDEPNCSSLYTLSLLLAEARDLDGAIDYVKMALTSNTHRSTEATLTKERELVPLWHLLALLLSAKQDFDIAERSCEAAFEQFPAAITALVHKQAQDTQSQSSASGLKNALIDQLHDREKERILETRMTQLAFVELLEGPETAVNQSGQLFRLFATLFQNLDLGADDRKSAKAEHLIPPKSSAGTVKSFRGSLFGRHKASRGSTSNDFKTASPIPSVHHEHGPSVDSTPAIQVTNEENGIASEPQQNIGRTDSTRQKLQKRPSNIKPVDEANHVNGTDGLPNGQGSTDANGTRTPQQQDEETPSQDMVGIAVSGTADPHHMNNAQHQYLEQDVRSPTSYGFDSSTGAVTKFPLAQSQKHAFAMLVKIWLLIAGLYRRASLFDDAHEACEEASKHVARFEALVAAQESSAKSFRSRGWAAIKSSEELWADLHAEQGLLSRAQSRPHEAIELFEEALMRDPDHPKATISLANLLLDIWDRTLPLEPPPTDDLETAVSTLSLLSTPLKLNKSLNQVQVMDTDKPEAAEAVELNAFTSDSAAQDEDAKLLNRIAARDRAYGLLSALTKRGSSWDNSEAWYALSRAYEAGGQVEKLKEVLWWCIELEDRRPIRHWSNIGSGLYVL